MNSKGECKYEVICKAGKGFVVRCRHCKGLSLAFGNVAMNLEEDEFRYFHDLLLQKCQAAKKVKRNRLRCIRVETPMPSMQWLFSKQELDEFSELMTRALLILEARRSAN